MPPAIIQAIPLSLSISNGLRWLGVVLTEINMQHRQSLVNIDS